KIAPIKFRRQPNFVINYISQRPSLSEIFTGPNSARGSQAVHNLGACCDKESLRRGRKKTWLSGVGVIGRVRQRKNQRAQLTPLILPNETTPSALHISPQSGQDLVAEKQRKELKKLLMRHGRNRCPHMGACSGVAPTRAGTILTDRETAR